MVEQDTGFDAAYRRVCSADRAFEGLRLCISVHWRRLRRCAMAWRVCRKHGPASRFQSPEGRSSISWLWS